MRKKHLKYSVLIPSETRGATLAEYVILLVTILVVAVVALQTFGINVNKLFLKVVASM